MNLDNDVSLPTNLCTSFRFLGLLISRTARHLSGLAFDEPLQCSTDAEKVEWKKIQQAAAELVDVQWSECGGREGKEVVP